jgi:nucleotidyltransferase/DNA polymerase involved in DNA repair
MAFSRRSSYNPVLAHRPRKSIGCETAFQYDIPDRTRFLAALGSLCREANARLRQSNRRAGTVTLKLRFANFEAHTRALTLGAAVAGESHTGPCGTGRSGTGPRRNRPCQAAENQPVKRG